jgi:hypothetical protein
MADVTELGFIPAWAEQVFGERRPTVTDELAALRIFFETWTRMQAIPSNLTERKLERRELAILLVNQAKAVEFLQGKES